VSKLADLLPEKVREYGKAIVAMVFPALWTYIAVMRDGVTLVEWGMVAVTALAAGGWVAAVPNRLTLEQVNRYFDQTEDKYKGRFEWLDVDEVAVNRADFETPGEREAREHMEREERDEPPDGRGKHRRE
jgi:hypothetical protein